MRATPIEPLQAIAGATALTVKDALRFTRHSLREGRRRLPRPTGPAAGVAKFAERLFEGVDRGAGASAEAARAVLRRMAGAGAAPALPAPLDALAACVAAHGEPALMGLADSTRRMLGAILARLGAPDALVLEQPLRWAWAETLESDGDAASLAARLARALDRGGAAPIPSAAASPRVAWFAAALALLAATRHPPMPGETAALRDAATDLAAAIPDEIEAAFADPDALERLLRDYADHL